MYITTTPTSSIICHKVLILHVLLMPAAHMQTYIYMYNITVLSGVPSTQPSQCVHQLSSSTQTGLRDQYET